MRARDVFVFGLAGCGWLFSCFPSVEMDESITTSAQTIAVFAPNAEDACLSVLPFPSDLAKNPETGTLDVPYCTDDDETTISIKRGLRTLGGYSLNVPMTTEFSGSIDTGTLAGNVLVLNARSQAPVAVTPVFDSTTNTLVILADEPLVEDRQYIVAVASGVKDATGADIASDQAFTFLKSKEPLVDSAGYSRFASLDDGTANGLEPLREGYQKVFEALELASFPREQILVAWMFTTQTVHSALADLAAFVVAKGGATVTHDNVIAAADHPLLGPAGIPITNLCKIHTGRVTINDLLTDAGTFGVDLAGAPLSTETSVDYLLTTPNALAADCSGDNPDLWDFANVAVFVHGLGSCKNTSLAIANAFGQANWAVLALDGPRAGSRTVGNLGDQDMDTCPDQPDTPELIALGDESPNPFGIRDRLREWGLELVQATAAVKAEVRNFSGADTTTPLANPPTVALLGHSWGGMAAVLAGSVSTNVDVLATTVASGELGAVFAPSVTESVAAELVAAGLTPGSPQYEAQLSASVAETVSTFRWVLEPADPLYAAAAFPSFNQLPVLTQVVVAASDDALADAPLHDRTTQQILANALSATHTRWNLADVTFILECSDAPVCTDGADVAAAPLAPCNDGGSGDVDYAYTAALQTQLVTFLVSEGALVSSALDVDVCP